jgi:hypothetical protein
MLLRGEWYLSTSEFCTTVSLNSIVLVSHYGSLYINYSLHSMAQTTLEPISDVNIMISTVDRLSQVDRHHQNHSRYSPD